ncbi:hypothetical protein BRADI_4g43080v3 [Brachypodium distachyon]|uniref:RNA polymerase subunit H/Rpb5 C-terminal domain-containing protein n=2 Tax=Brachypodium distachyon TaxID=15368 RepID=A0A0Q3HFU7_BRADI|nr:hypothetical protein BRADI_4g43080v3 [Brachypodium distachyon]
MDQPMPSSQRSSPSIASAESTAASSTAPMPKGAPARVPAAAAAAAFDDVDEVPEVVEWMASMVDRGGRASHEVHSLFLARRTALEMLRDRGYSVPEPELARTLTEFRAWWAEKPEMRRLSFSATFASDHSNKVQFVFCPPKPVNITTIREVYSQIEEENLSRLILILQGDITSKARDCIKEIFPFKVDIFQVTELLVNISKHELKPKHEVLTAEEKAELLKKYNLEDSRLPCMLENDAVARYYGLGKGTIVKITYDGELTGHHVTYRCIF